MDAEQVKARLTAHYDVEAERRGTRGLADFRAVFRQRYLDLLSSESIAGMVDLRQAPATRRSGSPIGESPSRLSTSHLRTSVSSAPRGSR